MKTDTDKAAGSDCQQRLVSLEEFLRAEAGDLLESDWGAPIVRYEESVNPDAANGDGWLENNTSYIWKVGVLSIADGNKRDWAHLLIGHQRKPGASFEFIGKLHWQDGENDDPGRCLRRYVECANRADILFEGQMGIETKPEAVGSSSACSSVFPEIGLCSSCSKNEGRLFNVWRGHGYEVPLYSCRWCKGHKTRRENLKNTDSRSITPNATPCRPRGSRSQS